MTLDGRRGAEWRTRDLGSTAPPEEHPVPAAGGCRAVWCWWSIPTGGWSRLTTWKKNTVIYCGARQPRWGAVSIPKSEAPCKCLAATKSSSQLTGRFFAGGWVLETDFFGGTSTTLACRVVWVRQCHFTSFYWIFNSTSPMEGTRRWLVVPLRIHFFIFLWRIVSFFALSILGRFSDDNFSSLVFSGLE